MGDSYVVPPLPSPPPDPVPADDQVSELPRSYQVWKGNNVFLLRGTLIFGPDARSVLLTIALIVAPVVVFCSVVATKLIDEFPNYMGVLIFVIAVVLTLIGLVFLLSTSGRDPGIVPRNSRPPEPEGFEGYTPPVTPGQSPPFRLPRSKDVTVNGKVVKTKYCDTCMLYRPPRCSHCSICNNCVEKFDHHCPWVGQCIGLRNYRFFFMFIFTTTILCLYVHGFSWVYIKRIMEADEISIWKAMAKTPASIALIVYTFISVWFVGGLSAFHLYLISLNQSTYENFRYRYDGQANPYNRGVMKNFGEVFCSRIPQSKNNFRARVPKEAKIPPRVISANFASPNIDKTGGDIEMGRKPVWDEAARHGNDFGEMVRNDRGLNEDNGLAGISPELSRILLPHAAEGRSVLHSRRPSLGITGGNWDISPEVHPLAMRVGSNDGGNLTSERQLSQPDMDRKL